MAPLSTLLATERIVSDLQRAGERSLIIGDGGQFFFEPTGDRVVRISSKDSAAACIAAIEATLNPNVIQQQRQQRQQQASKKWPPLASVECVVV